jgi:hypothetical protein
LCKSKELSYIDYDDSDLPKFLKGLESHLSPLLTQYKNNDLKSSTLADLNDYSGDISGEWSDKKSITLFAKTPSTYTLSIISSGYSGGAHGYYAMEFENFSIETQKEIKLSDLFQNDFNTTLHNIAQDIYKKTYGLKTKQSLHDDGWFENKFVLAENFAITSKGLLFYYNSYEIKPYSAGHTRFMLPYHKIKSIIQPEGILGFVFQKSNDFNVSSHEKDVATVTLSYAYIGVNRILKTIAFT